MAEVAHLNENSQQIIDENTEEIHSGELFKINKYPLVLSLKDVSLNQEQPPTITKDLRKVAKELNAGDVANVLQQSSVVIKLIPLE